MTTLEAALKVLQDAGTPLHYRELTKRILAAIGFEEVEVTSRTKDGGIDVRGTLVVGDVIRTRLAVQVKRWKQNVQSPVIQQVRGSLGAHEQGLVINTRKKIDARFQRCLEKPGLNVSNHWKKRANFFQSLENRGSAFSKHWKSLARPGARRQAGRGVFSSGGQTGFTRNPDRCRLRPLVVTNPAAAGLFHGLAARGVAPAILHRR